MRFLANENVLGPVGRGPRELGRVTTAMAAGLSDHVTLGFDIGTRRVVGSWCDWQGSLFWGPSA